MCIDIEMGESPIQDIDNLHSESNPQIQHLSMQSNSQQSNVYNTLGASSADNITPKAYSHVHNLLVYI